MINIGVIGTGFGRYVHIPGFMSLNNVNVVGVASGSYENACQTAKESNLRIAFKSWKDLINCPDIQAISIAMPPYMLAEICLASIEAGKAVLCEKPMAMSAGQAQKMLEAAQLAGVVHMIDFEFTEIPAFRYAKALLEKGLLGRIRHVKVDWIGSSWANPNRPLTWRADKSKGGGVLATHGVHTFNYIEWLLEPVRSVFAYLRTNVTARPDQFGISKPVNTEDSCHLVFELRSGIPVTANISTVAPVGRGHQIEIDGEKMTVIIISRAMDYCKGFQVWAGDLQNGRLALLPIPPEMRFRKDYDDGRIAPFERLAGRFVKAIEKEIIGERPSFEDGYRARLLMDKAYEANDEHSWVSVPG